MTFNPRNSYYAGGSKLHPHFSLTSVPMSWKYASDISRQIMAVINTTATTPTAGLSQPSGLRVVHPETVTRINIDGALRIGEGSLHGAPALTSTGIDRMVRTYMGRETTSDPTKRSRRARGLQQSRQATRQTRQAQTTAPLSASSQGGSRNP